MSEYNTPPEWDYLLWALLLWATMSFVICKIVFRFLKKPVEKCTCTRHKGSGELLINFRGFCEPCLKKIDEKGISEFIKWEREAVDKSNDFDSHGYQGFGGHIDDFDIGIMAQATSPKEPTKLEIIKNNCQHDWVKESPIKTTCSKCKVEVIYCLEVDGIDMMGVSDE